MPSTALLAVACLTLAAGLELGRLEGYQVLWQIGEFDGSPAEFALAPDGARQFTHRFPQDPVYVVGESLPSDWPFIHPNEADTAWGGAAHHEFTVAFEAERRITGRCALVIALADVHERLAPEMRVSVNGHEHRRRLQPGAGRAYYGEVDRGTPQTVWIEFDGGELRTGRNEVRIGLGGGSWVAYDALALLKRETRMTSGRRPKAKPHALTAWLGPVHQDFGAPAGWDSDLLALDGQAGWLCLLGARGQGAALPGSVADEHFIVGFDLRVVQGRMGLEYAVEHAAAPYWVAEWDEQGMGFAGQEPVALEKGTWRVTVQSAPAGTELGIETPDGGARTLGRTRHVPGPPGRLRFVVLDDMAHAYVTNVSVTHALRVRAREMGERRAEVTLSTGVPHGEVRATVQVLGQEGEELGRRLTTWREWDREASVSLKLPEEGEPQRVVCELRQQGRRGPIWVIETSEIAGQAVAPARGAAAPVPARPPGAYALATDDGWVVGNRSYEVLIPAGDDQRPVLLVDRADGTCLANRPYSYAPLGDEQEHRVVGFDVQRDDGGPLKAVLTTATGPVTVRHVLVFPPDGGSFAERLEFSVAAGAAGAVAADAAGAVDLSRARCGWVRAVAEGGGRGLAPDVAEVRLLPVPWRRDTWGGRELLDLTVPEVIWRQGWYRETGAADRSWVPEHGSEGWLWDTGRGGTLIAKLNESFMEWALLDRVVRGEEPALRLGGCGVWHGDPARWQSVEPGETVSSGWTYYIHYDGDWREGFYAFRDLLARHGHGCPFDFNPPVHWNELYDNPLWWGPDTPERRKKHYTLRDMLVEAEKAREAGCQALYLDPGWDTVFGSHLWDEERLGPAGDFVRRMREEFGLKVALHTPVADWASAGGGGATYPREAWRVTEAGDVIGGSLCSGSRAYLEEEARRLIELADAGVVYFMFDGSRYTGPCFSREHGHPVPYTRDDHVAALRQLACAVHERHPGVIIEQHDQVVAGVHSVYVPAYLGHGDGGWDERWANEYMWRPLQDIKEGRALSLYYYNLAYHLPQYIHIDLRDDNEHCLALWWYASTCRHLGIGGTRPDGGNWLNVQRHMAEYLRLQEYYKRGVFYGLDEEIHVHVVPERGAVVNVFNLSDAPVKRQFFVDLGRMGLRPDGRVYVRGAGHVRLGDGAELAVELPAWGAKVVEVVVGR